MLRAKPTRTPDNPIIRLNIIPVAVALAALCGFDIYIFLTGKSWTFFQYESILPILLIGQKGHVAWKAIALSLLVTSTKVLFYEFGLTFNLIRESLAGSLLIAGTAAVLVASSLKDVQKNLKLHLLGILFFLSAVITDKTIAEDKLFSSYLLPQTSFGQQPYPSINPLKKEIEASIRDQGSILIVWESLGWPKNSTAIEAFKVRHQSASVKRIEHEGGSTLSAEIRYLCGSNSGVMDYANCVPQKTQSVAFHGNTLSYFQRQVEYKKMGFKKYYGRQDLSELPLCHYAYNAACDSDLIEELIQSATNYQCKGLFYALTIDSHFPYRKYQSHVHGLLEDVSNTIEKLKKFKQAFSDCDIVIIGDHPPPFSTSFDPKAVMRIDIH